ncbi:hypothetical protein DEO72_LG9g1566 [Vigna unguiculata]|uniref:Uncharacterized protein n=1 Tax=Vigna unguiculata TaxID=3917 RepID=A0A4D6N0S1_VIGUN|nr:hypothetical protein DEO72_LG9g1566 [Vigna unguiculata]
MDAVNFIYCVNLPAPPKRYYTLLMYSLYSPSSIHSCFFSPSFCAMVPLTRASALHSLQSFYLWWSLEEVDSLKEVLLSNCVSSSKWYFRQVSLHTTISL